MTAYQTTLDFLQSLEQCGSTTVQRNQSLLENLFESLGTDGFTIQPVQKIIQNGIIHRNLRGLAEATVDGVNMVDVSFVLICVIFAALASGLTQVSFPWKRSLRIFFFMYYTPSYLFRDCCLWILWKWRSKLGVGLLKRRSLLQS